jgi:drug/metabolite transporter (DMT)-like permease
LAAAGQLQFKPRLGVLYMLGAIFVLGSTDAIVKWSTNNIDPIQIGFSRFVVSLVMVLWLVGRSQPGFAALRTRRPIEHATRAFCAAVELTAFYYAISLIPLPTAMSIVAASPIFGTLLGVIFLRERLRLGGWIAVFAGFGGMLLVVQPDEGTNSILGTVAVLTSVVLWCFAQLFARRLSTTESNLTILFYYAVGGVVILGLATPAVWVNPTPLEWAGILAVGIFGCLGQYLLILALRYAPMSLLAPFEYSALIWASLYGYLFWGDVLGPVAIFGVAIIVAACLYITRTMEH